VRAAILYLAASAAVAAALVLPLWGFAMSAPQYPDETLHLQVVRTGIAGDIHEIETLQQYIGVQFPTRLPELQWATRGIVVVAVLLLIATVVGDAAFGRAYRWICTAALLVFLAVSAAAVQVRLYHVGHDRNPNAPIRAIHDFTPPLFGPVKVGNFTVWSYPHAGAVFLLGAAALAVAGLRRAAEPTAPGARLADVDAGLRRKDVA